MDLKVNHYPDSIEIKLGSVPGLLEAVDEALCRQADPLPYVQDVYEHFEIAAKFGIPFKTFQAHATKVRVRRSAELREIRERALSLGVFREVLADLGLAELMEGKLGQALALDVDVKSLGMLAGTLRDVRNAEKTKVETQLKQRELDKARKLEEVGRAQGLTPEALAEIKSKVLGL